MRLRIIFILIGVVVAGTVAAAFAAGHDSNGSSKRITSVVAAFYPLAYAAEQVGGPGVKVANLTPAGSEPHDLELTPGQVKTVQGADLAILMGHGFQPQVERAAAGSNARVLSLLDTPEASDAKGTTRTCGSTRSGTRCSYARSARRCTGRQPPADSSRGCARSTASTARASHTAPATRSSPATPRSATCHSGTG